MPTQFSFRPVRKQGGRRVVDDECVPLSEVVNVIKDFIPGVDAENVRRQEEFRRSEEEARNEGSILLEDSYTPKEEMILRIITDVGDVVNRTGKWNGRKFNEVTRSQPDWFKRVAKLVLHDRYVYKSWSN